MKINNNNIIGFSVLVAILTIAFLYLSNKRKDEEIKKLRRNNLLLILESLRRDPSFSEIIIKQIQELIISFEGVDNKICNELAQVLELIQIGQVENAIEDLVKIIEHLLNNYYKDNVSYKSWLKEKKQKHSLHNLLMYCKEDNKITDIEYNFFISIKTIRNKEDHTLDLKLEEYLNISGILVGLGGIYKIASLVYPEMVEDNSSKLLNNNG